MPDVAERLFEDESLCGDEVSVDDVIRAAGGERQAIRALLIEVAELRAAFVATTSLGYRRGRQPPRCSRSPIR